MDPLDLLRANEAFEEQIAHLQVFDPRPARYAEPATPLHPRLRERLARQGLDRFYSHQALAIDASARGNDLVVVTGTNSGKSLCYTVPTLQACLTEPAARALHLFPTKALAQDQLGKLQVLVPPDVHVATYDGDTPTSRRPGIRKSAHIVLTNPDMLHVGILPGHEAWAKFLRALRVVVIDEMHVYRGVFGSHVGGIVRRLLRLCARHNNHPQIIGCSATIGNPAELFSQLTGRTPVLIDEDGSPQARRTFVFWNPPVLETKAPLSPNAVTAELLATLVENDLSTLAFCRARITAELVLKYARRRMKQPEMVESYRAGYTAKERRAIEKALFTGKLKGLAATSAMELGVDIGGLDAVILNGYPGSLSSFWQQAGRAGRGTREGFAIYVAHEDPLEQFLLREPELLLDAAVESVSTNPSNPTVLGQQLRCAAHEMPLAPTELERFGDTALALAEELEQTGDLSFRAGLFFTPASEPPAPTVDIRGAGGGRVVLTLNGEELGTMERWRALENAYPGAVYLHRGCSYVVQSLDLDRGEAEVVARETDFYTQALVQSMLETLYPIQEETFGRHAASLGSFRVTDSVIGFRRMALEGGHVVSNEELDLPPMTFETVGIQIDFPQLLNEADVARHAAGLHAMEHALMAVAPLLAGCDRSDLGSAWYAVFPETLAPALFVFDRTPGGVGLAESLWQGRTKWREAALQLLTGCPCPNGCPRCLLTPRCETNNEVLDKQGAVQALRMDA